MNATPDTVRLFAEFSIFPIDAVPLHFGLHKIVGFYKRVNPRSPSWLLFISDFLSLTLTPETRTSELDLGFGQMEEDEPSHSPEAEEFLALWSQGDKDKNNSTPLDSALRTTAKVTRSEVEKWMNKENKYFEKDGVGAGEGLCIGQDPELSTSISTLQVTINTTLMGEADLDETDFQGDGTSGDGEDLGLDLSATKSTLPQQPPSSEAVEVNVPAAPQQQQQPVEEKPKPKSAVAAEIKPKTKSAKVKPPMTNEEKEKAWKSANSAKPAASAAAPPKTPVGKQSNGGTAAPKSPSAAPVKRVPVTAASTRKPAAAASPTSAPPPASARTPSRRASAPVTPTTPGPDEAKKIPMNKIKVGAAPSPNVKDVKSKIGSLATSAHKPPTSHVKIEHNKLAWKAESRIGSLSNVKFTPSSSKVKIETKKVEVKGVGSKNVKYKPGGGDKKIFDDKYVKKTSNPSSNTPSEHGGGSIPPSPTPASANAAASAPPPVDNNSVSSSNNVTVTSVPVASLVNLGD